VPAFWAAEAHCYPAFRKLILNLAGHVYDAAALRGVDGNKRHVVSLVAVISSIHGGRISDQRALTNAKPQTIL